MVERKAEWFVNRVPDLQPKPGLPQKAATLIAEAGPLDAPHELDDQNLQPVAKGPATALEAALKTAVSAAAEAEKHGQQIGYNVRFTPGDIRALGITVLIGMQSGRAA